MTEVRLTLFSWSSAGQRVLLQALAERSDVAEESILGRLRTELAEHSPGRLESLFEVAAIRIETQAGDATLRLKAKFNLPGLLCTGAEGAVRLRTSPELAADIAILRARLRDAAEAERRETLAELLEQVEQLRRNLRDRLAGLDVDLAAEGAAFFGIRGVYSGGAAFSARLRLDAAALLDPPTTGSGSREILRAELAAALAFQAGGGATRSGAVELTCRITQDDVGRALVDLASSIALPPFPQLPPLRFELPRIPFPTLNLDSLDLGDPFRFLDFGLPLPTPGGGDFPLRIDWSTRPGFRLEVDADGLLSFATTTPGRGGLFADGTKLADLTDIALEAPEGAAYKLSGTVTAQQQGTRALPERRNLGEKEPLPFTVDIDPPTLRAGLTGTLDLADGTGGLQFSAALDFPRVVIRAKEDPRLVLALAATYEAKTDGAGVSGRLTRLEVVDPYPVALICAAAEGAVEGVMRLIGLIKVPGGPDLPGLPPAPDLTGLIKRVADLLAAFLKWAARQAGAAASALAGLAQSAIEMLGRLIEWLADRGKDALSHIAVEVRLDAGTYQLRQLLITPLRDGARNSTIEESFAGLEISLPADWEPTLLLDFSGPLLAALTVTPGGLAGGAGGSVTLSTDLWLKREGAPVENVRDVKPDSGERGKPLIRIEVAPAAAAVPIALVAYDDGELSFLRALANAPNPAVERIAIPGTQNRIAVARVRERPKFRDLKFAAPNPDVAVRVDTNLEAAGRLLPFLEGGKGGGASSGPSYVDKLSQYISIKKSATAPSFENGSTFRVPLDAEIHLAGMTTRAALELKLDLRSLSASLSGGRQFSIKGKRQAGVFLGMDYLIKSRENPDSAEEFEQFVLDLSGGNPRMALSPRATVDLSFSRLGTGGRGLMFKVSEFAVATGGFDIVAEVDPDEPVTLPGVKMPFNFTDGRLIVKRGEIQSLAIEGRGELPPELVGEASCRVRLTLGADAGGDLSVLACDAELDKTDEPIVCQSTRFTLTIARLGFAMQDFGPTGGGYQFYFLVTGTIVFTPSGDEFGNTFLKNLRGAKITLNKAPLARDMRLLAKAIEFQIPLDPKLTIDLFDIFAFELRGFGFHPASPAFGGAPALSISGQARFLETGDTISAKMDFHQMWIAPPESPNFLPRIRFDGLGVSLSFKGAGTVEGTAVVVDGNLPTLFPPSTLPPRMTAHGFLASGRLNLKGWASMSASMGFLQLSREGESRKRHAFFLYGQKDLLSEPVPTPIKEIYLREVGFGFGYRYTLAGLRRADDVQTPQALIQVLDDVSKYQNDLAKFTAWEPEAVGNRFTLALRGMLSVESRSTSGQLSKAEEKLPNPLLFDVSAALRSDLTFLMTVRAWLAVNYHDWVNAENRDDIASNPTLRGYLYISAPRQELLARLLSDPRGYIGKNPEYPPQLIEAFRGVKWSSTLYIRPGLFHFEYGWPYELEIKIEKENFGIICQGGMVFRVEDSAMLHGIAFRATGYARIGGQAGGSSLGASVRAEARFSLEGKFISYISVRNFQDSLFYGSIGFACTVKFEVRVWLRFKVGPVKVKLEASFSLQLSLSVALEIAIGPDLIAGRGSARIGVSAFGRTLSLGVGFGFNTNDLALARSRVERFLALGLTAAVPDPAGGLQQVSGPAAPLPSVAAGGGDGDFDSNAETHGGLSQIGTDASQPGDSGPITIDGAAIGPPRFWAMLFEVPARPGSYVMQLVPRDHTSLAARADDELALAPADSTFFARPHRRPLYRIGGTAPARLKADGSAPVPENEIAMNPDAVVATTEDGFQLTLGMLLEEAFVREQIQVDPKEEDPVVSRDGAFLQPGFQRIEAERLRYASPEAEAAALRDASSDAARMSWTRAEWRAAEERRSSIVAAVAASAERIAQLAVMDGGALKWPASVSSDTDERVDARDLGLTFFVTGEELGTLFDGDEERPPKSQFSIEALDEAGLPVARLEDPADPGQGAVSAFPVHLFNPPHRSFLQRQPRLAGLGATRRPEGLALDWDLEPAWTSSTGFWDDPEFHLKHYRIERIFLSGGGIVAIPPMSTTVKAAAPLKPVAVAGGGDVEIEWHPIRPLAQFVDDFADVDPDWRKALLQRDHADDKAYREALEAFRRFADGGDRIDLQYTIVPVDIGGNEGPAIPFETSLCEPVAPNPQIGRAELAVEFRRIPGLPAAAGEQARPLRRLSIRVDDIIDQSKEKDQPERLPPDGATYRIKVRTERATPVGLFGSDMLSQALQRPSPADFAREEAGDETFELQVRWPASWQSDIDAQTQDRPSAAAAYRRVHGLTPLVVAASDAAADPTAKLPTAQLVGRTYAQLLTALGINEDGAQEAPKPVRVAIRRVADPANGRRDSPWLPVDALLRIGAPGIDEVGRPLPRPVDTVVETFESPCVAGYAPLKAEDLYGEAGRLLIDYPSPKPEAATLANLLDPEDGKAPLLTLRDGERRIATRLRWNAWPTSGPAETPGATVANASPALIAGWDVFEVDLGGIVVNDDQLRTATAVARVQALDPRVAKADPAQIDDFGAVEAFYPSESKRLTIAKAGRRASWYSPAESLLDWPRIALRRSLGLDAEEGDLATVFERGQPETITVSWEGAPEAGLPGGGSWKRLKDVAKEGVDPPQFAWIEDEDERPGGADPVPAPASAARFRPRDLLPIDAAVDADTERWTAARLRRLMFGLALSSEGDGAWPDKGIGAAFADGDSEALAAALRDLRITVIGWRGQRETGRATIVANLDQPLHPLLADAVDMLRWERGPGETCYRRYRPVAEAPPPTEAKGAAELIDERPPERDPYGWAILRTLGLAQGFRIYDMERGDFVEPERSLQLVSRALATARRRYEGLSVGAPFVEILARPGGLMQVASFDGGIPASAGPDDLLRNEALTLVQLSLRPLAEGLTGPPEEDAADGSIAYFVLHPPVDGGGSERLDVAALGLDPLRQSALIDVIDLGSGLGDDKVVTLARSDDAVARLLKDRGLRFRTDLGIAWRPPTPPSPPAPLLLARVVTLGLPAEEAMARLVAGTALRPERVDRPGQPVEPFGRFPELPAEVIVALVHGVEGVDEVPDQEIVIPPQIAAARSYGRFARFVGRRFPAAPAASQPADEEAQERVRFFARWPNFVGRFLDHGPVAFDPEPGSTPFALATLPRPDPLRLRVQADGTQEMLLLHKDRRARRRRYLVRPFGRYDNLAAAWDASRDGIADEQTAGLIGWIGRRSLLDNRPGEPPAGSACPLPRLETAGSDPLAAHALDIVVPRTEPLAPPVILSARRLDVGEGTDRRPGRLLEVIVGRHQEELASESNSLIAESLQFEHVGFGFWREFAHPSWADGLARLPDETAVDLLPALDGGLADPAPLSFSGSGLEESPEGARHRSSLAARLADGWRGITVVRTDAVPHFYRLHVAAFAAAGVVVSDAVATVIPEGQYALHWPWTPGMTGASATGVHWSVRRTDTDGGATGRVVVRVSIPLVRYLDGMTEADRKHWLGNAGGRIPPAFLLPDPGVAYELATHAAASGEAGLVPELSADRAVELGLFASVGSEAGAMAQYQVRSSGERFTASEILLASQDGDWRLAPALERRRAAGRVAQQEDVDPPLGQAGAFELPASSWRGFVRLAPSTSATFTITRPAGATPAVVNWALLDTNVRAVIALLDPYLAEAQGSPTEAGIREALAQLTRFADVAAGATPAAKAARWVQLAGGGGTVGNVDARFTVQDWAAGLPIYPSAVERPGDVPELRDNASVRIALGAAWKAPDAGIGLAERLTFAPAMAGARRRAATAAELDRIPSLAEGYTRPVFAWLWAREHSALAAEDGAGIAGYRPVGAAVPPDLRDEAAALAGNLSEDPGPRLYSPRALFELLREVEVDFSDDVRVPGSAAQQRFVLLQTALRESRIVEGQGPAGLGLYPALAALAAIELSGTGPAQLRIPVAALAPGHPVRLALAGLAAIQDPPVPAMLLLRRPPDDEEMAALAAAGISPALLALIEAATADQIFGAGRRLFVKAAKGFVDPLQTYVPRRRP
jgi:hypothetical protein